MAFDADVKKPKSRPAAAPKPIKDPAKARRALEAHDAIAEESAVLRRRAGLPPVEESSTVRAWRELVAADDEKKAKKA